MFCGGTYTNWSRSIGSHEVFSLSSRKCELQFLSFDFCCNFASWFWVWSLWTMCCEFYYFYDFFLAISVNLARILALLFFLLFQMFTSEFQQSLVLMFIEFCFNYSLTVWKFVALRSWTLSGWLSSSADTSRLHFYYFCLKFPAEILLLFGKPRASLLVGEPWSRKLKIANSNFWMEKISMT